MKLVRLLVLRTTMCCDMATVFRRANFTSDLKVEPATGLLELNYNIVAVHLELGA